MKMPTVARGRPVPQAFLPLLFLGTALLAAGAGCERHPLYQYANEPYEIRRAAGDDGQLERRIGSMYRDERQTALRLYARRAREAYRKNALLEASHALNRILERFARENDPAVRSWIVAVCIPDAGIANDRVRNFLRACIAEGDCAEDAVFALAALWPGGAYETLSALLLHPDRELRYRAALALSCTTDPRAPERLRAFAGELRGRGAAVPANPLARQRARNIESRLASMAAGRDVR
jgi:hypothetical protein